MEHSNENSPLKSRFRPIAAFIFALQFLTRIPLPIANQLKPMPMAQVFGMFGLVGGLIGALNGLLLVGVNALHLPPLMGATLVVGIGLLLTGALHEDGLADTFDGLFGGKTKERRLEIMRDSRIGTYGACALLIAILMRVGAYEKISTFPWQHVVFILASAGAVSRAAMVYLLANTRAARIDGLAHMMGAPSNYANTMATATTLAICGWTWFVTSIPMVGIVALSAMIAYLLVRHVAMRRIGGQTGDICGALQVLSELAILTLTLIRIH